MHTCIVYSPQKTRMFSLGENYIQNIFLFVEIEWKRIEVLQSQIITFPKTLFEAIKFELALKHNISWYSDILLIFAIFCYKFKSNTII